MRKSSSSTVTGGDLLEVRSDGGRLVRDGLREQTRGHQRLHQAETDDWPQPANLELLQPGVEAVLPRALPRPFVGGDGGAAHREVPAYSGRPWREPEHEAAVPRIAVGVFQLRDEATTVRGDHWESGRCGVGGDSEADPATPGLCDVGEREEDREGDSESTEQGRRRLTGEDRVSVRRGAGDQDGRPDAGRRFCSAPRTKGWEADGGAD